jgi:hypothetical protein
MGGYAEKTERGACFSLTSSPSITQEDGAMDRWTGRVEQVGKISTLRSNHTSKAEMRETQPRREAPAQLRIAESTVLN